MCKKTQWWNPLETETSDEWIKMPQKYFVDVVEELLPISFAKWCVRQKVGVAKFF